MRVKFVPEIHIGNKGGCSIVSCMGCLNREKSHVVDYTVPANELVYIWKCLATDETLGTTYQSCTKESYCEDYVTLQSTFSYSGY